MIDLSGFLAGLAAALVLAMGGWAYSVARGNVNIVDTLWPMFFVVVLGVHVMVMQPASGAAREWLVGALLMVWALRLAAHLGERNHGEPEDHRYAAIRARNEPGFAFKSLYLVFALQAVLAWIIASPLAAAAGNAAPLGALDMAGAALCVTGILFETVADLQLRRFKRDPGNRGKVLDSGLWRYTRHPNYFGEACVWWGFWLMACAAGAAWTVYAPILMTVLLLKVSGVALLEKDIAARRPGYADYILHTNAFLPGLPRRRT